MTNFLLGVATTILAITLVGLGAVAGFKIAKMPTRREGEGK